MFQGSYLKEVKNAPASVVTVATHSRKININYRIIPAFAGIFFLSLIIILFILKGFWSIELH
jgi:hypothetical protein